jgi:hypothetical protein
VNAFSAAVVAEVERLGGHVAGGEIEWPKGVTYRTSADDRADREVWWAEFGGARPIGARFMAFGTSHGGKVVVCTAKDDDRPSDPIVHTLHEGETAPSPSHRLSIFLASLEREPTRKRR